MTDEEYDIFDSQCLWSPDKKHKHSGMTERQNHAVGSKYIWKVCREDDTKEFNSVLAKACIKLQTFF